MDTAIEMPASPWEMGSEFHLLTDTQTLGADTAAHRLGGELHVSGRAALVAILDRISDRRPRIWLPTYLCPDVRTSLRAGLDVASYGDYPDEPTPRFDSLRAEAGDVVLAQDTFGLGDPDQWASWMSAHPDVTVIEDITHHCTQERFLRSPAHHVFASLRKSLPVADGGIVFSQDDGLERVSADEHHGSLLKLEAMVMKASFLRGQAVDKQSFRDLQVSGENLLGQANRGGCLAHTAHLVQVLDHDALVNRWGSNNRRLARNLSQAGIEGQARPLTARTTCQGGPFHTVLKCVDRPTRERLRRFLISRQVYPAIHWLPDRSSTQAGRRVTELSQSLLTVPTDFRYSDGDIDKLTQVIEEGLRSV